MPAGHPAPSVAIVGAGFAGIGAAIRLKQAGITDITLFDRGEGLGGVWRDNVYPGAACDVPSHLYSFSFAPKPDWTNRYALQPEIRGYLIDVATRFGVLPHLRFRTEVEDAVYDEERAGWTLHLGDGTTHEVDILVTATGQLSRPAEARLPGLESFDGEVFHSARWPKDFDPAGRRIAVIGTGASAIQFVPAIAPAAGELTVFQRSAPYVVHKHDPIYSEATKLDYARHPARLLASRWATYWANESRSLGFNTEPRLMALVEAVFRANLRRDVPDPALRKKLTPTDRMGCKRILQSNDWYPALQLPHVNVETEAITEVRPHAVVTADGREHPVDTLIHGTGFRATEFLAPMEIRGRGGLELSEHWREGARAYLGMTMPGFPNLFQLYGPNTNLGHNSIIFMLEAQIDYVVQGVSRLRDGLASAIEVRPEVADRFDAEVQEASRGTVFGSGCSSWYVDEHGRYSGNWPGSTVSYRRRTRHFRDSDFVFEPVRDRQLAAAV